MNYYGHSTYRPKLTIGDKVLLIFFGALLAGTVIINLIPFSYVSRLNVWGEEYINNYIRKDIKFEVMLKYLMDMRVRIFAVILIMLLSPYTKGIIYGISGYLGAAWGVSASVILMEYGINGIRLCFFLVFPHYIFYITALTMLGYKIMLMKQKQKLRVDMSLVMVIFLVMLVILCGIVAETYVNTTIIEKIL